MKKFLFSHVFIVFLALFGVILNVRAGEPGIDGAEINGDTNCDGIRDLSDAITLLNWLYVGGRRPCPLAEPVGLREQVADLESSLAERNQRVLDLEAQLERTTLELGDRLADANRSLAALRVEVETLQAQAGDCGDLQVEGFTRLEQNEQGYWEYIHDQTGMVFIRLPGGTFTMGATVPFDTLDVPNQQHPTVEEFPAHEVTLSPFMIAKYECTQSEWETVMESNPSRFVGNDRPVHQVSWEDVQGFESLSGLSLPTEAQWEYAVRAGTRTRFFFGDDPGPANAGWPIAQLYTVFSPEGLGARDDEGPAEVGTLRPNQFGLFDMYGNVYEWCEDYYVPDFYSQPEATRLNPVADGPEGNWRVIRGASYRNSNPDGAFRSARRPAIWKTNRNVDYGFRAVFNFPE